MRLIKKGDTVHYVVQDGPFSGSCLPFTVTNVLQQLPDVGRITINVKPLPKDQIPLLKAGKPKDVTPDDPKSGKINTLWRRSLAEGGWCGSIVHGPYPQRGKWHFPEECEGEQKCK